MTTDVLAASVLTRRPPGSWSDIASSDDASYFVAYLDQARAVGVTPKERGVALLDLRPGERVLDLGCGTGDDTVVMARSVAPDEGAVGVDVAAPMIDEAERRHSSADGVEFLRAPAEQLPIEDAAFDACFVERVLQHVDSPTRVLPEVPRVLRPGGRLVVIEPDWGMSATDYVDDEELATRLRIARAADPGMGLAKQPVIGRKLYRSLRAAGLDVRIIDPIPTAFCGPEWSQMWATMAASNVTSLTDCGLIDDRDAADVRAAIEQAASNGDFFAVNVMFLVCAVRPEATI